MMVEISMVVFIFLVVREQRGVSWLSEDLEVLLARRTRCLIYRQKDAA